MKESRALDRVRELGRLGLPAETFVLASLREMRALLPRAGAAFFWLDGGGRISNCCAEHLPASCEIVAGDDASFVRAVLDTHGARDVTARDLGTYGRVHGRLCVYGRDGERLGNACGTEWLDCLARDLLRGLVHAGSPDEAVRCDRAIAASEELLVCRGDGRIAHATAGSRTMLLLASGVPLNASSLGRAEAAACAMLASLCARFTREGPAGAVTRDTAWGTFSLAPRHMSDACGGDTRLIAVQLRRYEPAELRMREALEANALSARQREVALLVSLGRSNAQIGTALCVSANTVAYHVKSLFERFGVHNRAGLASRLAAARVGPGA